MHISQGHVRPQRRELPSLDQLVFPLYRRRGEENEKGKEERGKGKGRGAFVNGCRPTWEREANSKRTDAHTHARTRAAKRWLIQRARPRERATPRAGWVLLLSLPCLALLFERQNRRIYMSKQTWTPYERGERKEGERERRIGTRGGRGGGSRNRNEINGGNPSALLRRRPCCSFVA